MAANKCDVAGRVPGRPLVKEYNVKRMMMMMMMMCGTVSKNEALLRASTVLVCNTICV
jgi:hypothetical protein